MSSILEGFRLSLANVRTNRLRSALAMLSILIGVATTIMLLSLGDRSAAEFENALQGLGPDLLIVYPGSSSPTSATAVPAAPKPLTLSDLKAVEDPRLNPHVLRGLPAVQLGIDVSNGQLRWPTQAIGTTEDFPAVLGYRIDRGRAFSASEASGQARVAVLGNETAGRLFRNDDPVGKRIRIGDQPFRVIGTTAAKGTSGFGNQDDVIYMPIAAVWSYLDSGSTRELSALYAKASDSRPATVDRAKHEVTRTLLSTHRIKNPEAADFQIFNPQDILKSTAEANRIFTLFLAAVAGISLLIGGIGIMNIQLVTVFERTREIGIRKAVGARRRDILRQFLAESVFLSAAGGGLGIVVGIPAALGLEQVAQIPPRMVPLRIVLLGVLVAIAIGLFFGIYPAHRASRLQPMEALRYE